MSWLEPIARRPRLAALIGAMCIAFSGIFYRFAEVSPSTATVFRCLYGPPILALVGWYEHRRFGPLPSRAVWLAVLAGVFFAGDLLSWHHAVDAVGAGLATVLGNLQVLVVGLAAWVLFKERVPRPALIALPIVLAGVVLISGVIGAGAYGANPTLGVSLGIFTAFCYAGYLLVIRRGSNDLRRPAGPVAIATASTAVCSIVVGILLGELDPVPSFPSHFWLILVGVTSQSIGYLVISISLPRLPAALTSIILLAQPVATVVLARVIPSLDETPSLAQLTGVALVVGGIAIATVPVGRLRDRMRAAT
ncbi:MAG TPA: DMT family transporter, partial [Candidatus Limnocylindrales bacterium]|nr:DMT family transporter [Candidatus Limnocylindrales bacterium]